MDKVLLFVFALFSATANAVSMENDVFSLNANQINFKVGEITAKENVQLRIKSLEDIAKLSSKSNVALSELTQQQRVLNISLADGWTMKGRILAIRIDGEAAIIESDELYLVSEQLLAHKL
ncbi:MAG: hypothetical protein ACPG8A_03755 [Psychrobium sp.]